jgi:dipeptidase D
MSQDIPGRVQTSLNLGVAKLGEEFKATFSVRSSVNAEKVELLQKLEKLCEMHDGTYSQVGDYPAWEYKKDSRLRDVMVAEYETLYGKKPVVEAIHAGLECGLLSDKLPGLDAVSFGPNMEEIHTPNERLSISSVERSYNYLCKVIEKL